MQSNHQKTASQMVLDGMMLGIFFPWNGNPNTPQVPQHSHKTANCRFFFITWTSNLSKVVKCREYVSASRCSFHFSSLQGAAAPAWNPVNDDVRRLSFPGKPGIPNTTTLGTKSSIILINKFKCEGFMDFCSLEAPNCVAIKIYDMLMHNDA